MIPPKPGIRGFEKVHMTDVPYGRGGSPLQNLIARGHTSTKLTAMRMTAEVDKRHEKRSTESRSDNQDQDR